MTLLPVSLGSADRWNTIVGFADEPQTARGQQSTIVAVSPELFVIGNLILDERLFHIRIHHLN